MSGITRKKALKIQKRLGIRFGFSRQLSKSTLPTDASVLDRINEALEFSYNHGFLAFVLPAEIIGWTKSRRTTLEDIYKQHYDTVLAVKELGAKYNIQLSFRTNLQLLVSSPLAAEMIKEKLRIFGAAADIVNARTIAIHPGPYKDMNAKKASESAAGILTDTMKSVKEGVKVGVETTGRKNEFGTIEEVLELNQKTGVQPIIHFGHIHSRSNGKINNTQQFGKVMDKVKKSSPASMEDLFMFISGSKYKATGEIKHLAIQDSDLPVKSILEAIKQSGAMGTIIVDSPAREKDVIALMNLAEKVMR